MKLDLEHLMKELKQIKKQLREENNKNKEIMEQHEDIYKLLQDSASNVPSNYSYGD